MLLWGFMGVQSHARVRPARIMPKVLEWARHNGITAHDQIGLSHAHPRGVNRFRSVRNLDMAPGGPTL